jgi:hypothetical protein
MDFGLTFVALDRTATASIIFARLRQATAPTVKIGSLSRRRARTARGRATGFMQVCHGKAAPLRRIQPHDRVACYSPTLEFRGRDKCQAFTALGIVSDRQPYRGAAQGDFSPCRRDVTWLETRDAAITPLLDALELSAGRRNWGYQFRFGLFRISEHDMRFIAKAMGVTQFLD